MFLIKCLNIQMSQMVNVYNLGEYLMLNGLKVVLPM